MPREFSVSRFAQVGFRGRSLIFLAVADVVLFLIANVAYGAGDQHGLRIAVCNVAWVLFLARCLAADRVWNHRPGSVDMARGKAQA